MGLRKDALQLRHNERYDVANQQRLHCLLKWWFRRRSKKTSKLRVTSLCTVNSPVTGEFPAQKASNTENVFLWWRHHDTNGIKQNYDKMIAVRGALQCLVMTRSYLSRNISGSLSEILVKMQHILSKEINFKMCGNGGYFVSISVY